MKRKIPTPAKGLYRAYNTNRKIILAAGITLLAMIVSWLICRPTFSETNDDMIMASFAYGYMGKPSVYLAYINIIIGYILRALLLILPRVPWYTILQVGAVYVSSTVICYILLDKFEGKKAIFPVAFYYLFFAYSLFSRLQFTRTAAISATAGYALLFYQYMRDRRFSIGAFVLGALLVIWGSLYRFNMFMLISALYAVLGVVCLFPMIREGALSKAARFCAAFAVIIAVCFAGNLFNKAKYNADEDWKAFSDINGYRDALHFQLVDASDSTGFPDYFENKKLYNSLGILKNDYDLYKSYNIADPTYLNVETLKAIWEAREEKGFDASVFTGAMSSFLSSFSAYAVFTALLVALLVGVRGFLGNKKGGKLLILIYLALAFLAFQVYFYYKGRFAQARVDEPMILAVVVIVIMATWDRAWEAFSNRDLAIMLSAGVLLINIPAYIGYSARDAAICEQADLQDELRSMISSDKDHFYFYYHRWASFPDAMYHIWSVAEQGCGSNTSSLGSWRATTPVVQKKWAEYGISNPYEAIGKREDVYYMCYNNTQLDLVLRHIKDHYNRNASAYRIFDYNGDFRIYRITSARDLIDASNAVYSKGVVSSDIQVLETDNPSVVEICGYAFREGDNSFAANLYLGIGYPDGTEQIKCLAKTVREDEPDYLRGRFNGFDEQIALPAAVESLAVYYEAPDGALYKIPVNNSAASRDIRNNTYADVLEDIGAVNTYDVVLSKDSRMKIMLTHSSVRQDDIIERANYTGLADLADETRQDAVDQSMFIVKIYDELGNLLDGMASSTRDEAAFKVFELNKGTYRVSVEAGRYFKDGAYSISANVSDDILTSNKMYTFTFHAPNQVVSRQFTMSGNSKVIEVLHEDNGSDEDALALAVFDENDKIVLERRIKGNEPTARIVLKDIPEGEYCLTAWALNEQALGSYNISVYSSKHRMKAGIPKKQTIDEKTTIKVSRFILKQPTMVAFEISHEAGGDANIQYHVDLLNSEAETVAQVDLQGNDSAKWVYAELPADTYYVAVRAGDQLNVKPYNLLYVPISDLALNESRENTLAGKERVHFYRFGIGEDGKVNVVLRHAPQASTGSDMLDAALMNENGEILSWHSGSNNWEVEQESSLLAGEYFIVISTDGRYKEVSYELTVAFDGKTMALKVPETVKSLQSTAQQVEETLLEDEEEEEEGID